MDLRTAKKIRWGDIVKDKKTGELLTVENVTFVIAGIGYPADAIKFEFKEKKGIFFHRNYLIYKKENGDEIN